MNRVELIDAVASQTGLSKKDTKATFEAILETNTKSIVGVITDA
jgi:nucleoid DNA-binding protein